MKHLFNPTVAAAVIACAAAMTILLGLTPQGEEGGSWLNQLTHSWPFAVVYTALAVAAGLAAVEQMVHFRWCKLPMLLLHLGLFVSLTCAAIGRSAIREVQTTVFEGHQRSTAADRWGTPVELGMTIELHDFSAAFYPDGKPKRFASDITVVAPERTVEHALVAVNRPLRIHGWDIYQYGYDEERGDGSAYSTLMLVRDPWRPGVYAGFFLLLAGAACLLVTPFRRRWRFIVPAALLSVAAFLILLLRHSHAQRELMPALQSPWFAPHVVAYMIAFTLLGAATILALMQLLGGKKAEKLRLWTDALVLPGLAFLTFGMLLGAIWAQEAWGHYWVWDPKETWAAATWLVYLLYVHFRHVRPEGRRTAVLILLLAFACLQVSWWGVNYLPAAQGLSLHVY